MSSAALAALCCLPCTMMMQLLNNDCISSFMMQMLCQHSMRRIGPAKDNMSIYLKVSL